MLHISVQIHGTAPILSSYTHIKMHGPLLITQMIFRLLRLCVGPALNTTQLSQL
jgi:hypothetical protein